ncbi:hypothetical protein AOLI_G00262690 [Acnodon oligacanthus]
MMEKVSARLSKWNWLLPRLAYRGRVLVASNLAASTLWHRMMVLEPPEELIRRLQRKVVDFFWSGQHWTRAAVIFLPVEEGGQGLVEIRSRVTLAIQVDPGEERVPPGTLLCIPDLGQFQTLSRKDLYHVCVKVAHQADLRHQRVTRWLELFGPDFLLRDRWRSLYKPPLEQRSADLQWRILHGATATDRHVAHLHPSVGGQCRFRGKDETMGHLSLRCDRLSGLFLFLKDCFDALGEEFSDRIFIAGVKYKTSCPGQPDKACELVSSWGPIPVNLPKQWVENQDPVSVRPRDASQP